MTDEARTDDQLLVTPEEAARRLSVGRTTVYELLASGGSRSVSIGRCRRVPVSELCSYVARLMDGTVNPRAAAHSRLQSSRDYDWTQRLAKATVRRGATAIRVASDETPALLPLPRVRPHCVGKADRRDSGPSQQCCAPRGYRCGKRSMAHVKYRVSGKSGTSPSLGASQTRPKAEMQHAASPKPCGTPESFTTFDLGSAIEKSARPSLGGRMPMPLPPPWRPTTSGVLPSIRGAAVSRSTNSLASGLSATRPRGRTPGQLTSTTSGSISCLRSARAGSIPSLPPTSKRWRTNSLRT